MLDHVFVKKSYLEDCEREIAVLNTYFSDSEPVSVKISKKDMITFWLLDCMYVFIYLPSIVKMWLYIYKFVKSRIDDKMTMRPRRHNVAMRESNDNIIHKNGLIIWISFADEAKYFY